MTQEILRLHNVTKTYILGTRKNALKAQKAIQKFQKRYEKLARKQPDSEETKKLEARLDKAQRLFADEAYEESFRVIKNKALHPRPKDQGEVVHALKGVNITILPGELVAVIGPSGSGKSTLLNMLGMLDQPTAGRIYLNGQNVAAIRKRQMPDIRARELGFVFQSFNLIPTLTALENVMLPLKYSGYNRRESKQRARKALEQVELGNRLLHSPNELSGGQRQRVAIARSIVNNPAIIFGDELTGELDSKMTKDVMKLITELNAKGQTFIIVTHNPEVAGKCHRIIYMKDGQVERDVKHVEVRQP